MRLNLATSLAVLALAVNLSAATWSAGNSTWSEPDADSFDEPYRKGDAAIFGGAGAGGAIHIAAGGVNPGSIVIREGTYTFRIDQDNAMGAASITLDYGRQVTFSNTTGRLVSLANPISQPNGGNSLVFAGGDFRLTGILRGGLNSGPTLMPAQGVTLILEHGVAGPGDFSIAPEGTGATVRLLGPGEAGLVRIQGKAVTLEIGADNALGPRGRETVIGGTVTLAAFGGGRTIDNGIYSRGFSVAGSHDLTINGPIQNAEGYTVTKTGSAMLALNGDNSAWGNTLCLQEGVVRMGHTHALGTTRLLLEGGVLELGAGDFTRSLLPVAGPYSTSLAWTGSGGFSARGGRRAVNIGGAHARLTWGANGFVPAGQMLIFGSASADGCLDFQNPIDLGGLGVQGMRPASQAYLFGSKSPGSPSGFPTQAVRPAVVRTICVQDNPGSDSDVVVLSGVLSGAADVGLDKIGRGTLFLHATNSYTGNITVREGSIGGDGRLGGSLAIERGGGFVYDTRMAGGPLIVSGTVEIGDEATLTVLGRPRAAGRQAVMQALAGLRGRFSRVLGLPAGWVIDYGVAGEVALAPQERGL